MRKAYIIGKMRGIRHLNFPAFDVGAAFLRSTGFHPISPADLDRIHFGWAKYPPPHYVPTRKTEIECLSRDFDVIFSLDPRKDIIYALKGWQRSTFAPIEKALAEGLHIDVVYEI